jgi:predicted nucleic acid-binding protein
VVLPPAVAAELAKPPHALQAVDVNSYPFLSVRTPASSHRVLELLSILDAGEAEAIALAEELHADVVLIDELSGRNIARQCGFPVLGTLGILLRAKQERLCPQILPLLRQLQQDFGFFISPSLWKSILRQAGESDDAP